MSLKQRAKTYSAYDGAVTFYMLPHSTIAVRRVVEVFSGHFGSVSSWQQAHHNFALFVPLTVHIEFDVKDDHPDFEDIDLLRAYWMEKPSAILDGFTFFETLLPDTVMDEWDRAYTATRRTVLSADEVLQSSENPAADDDQKKEGMKPSNESMIASEPKPSGNSKKKQTESLSSAATPS